MTNDSPAPTTPAQPDNAPETPQVAPPAAPPVKLDHLMGRRMPQQRAAPPNPNKPQRSKYMAGCAADWPHYAVPPINTLETITRQQSRAIRRRERKEAEMKQRELARIRARITSHTGYSPQ